MNTDDFSLKATLMTALAAVILAALQLAAIDSLATPRSQAANVVQLPLVVVSDKREAVTEAVRQLPQVVVVGQRLERATAQVQAASEGSAI